MLHNTLQQNMILLQQLFPRNKERRMYDAFAMEQLNKNISLNLLNTIVDRILTIWG